MEIGRDYESLRGWLIFEDGPRGEPTKTIAHARAAGPGRFQGEADMNRQARLAG